MTATITDITVSSLSDGTFMLSVPADQTITLSNSVSGQTTDIQVEAGKEKVINIIASGYLLTVTKSGTGSGTATGTGVTCDAAQCTGTYNQGTVVTLTATPDSGSIFDGWSGECTGTGGCTITMDAAKTGTAIFTSTGQGDVEGNGNVDLTDAILSLQICAGIPPSAPINQGADVNQDQRIGLEEVIYILQHAAGTRP